MKRLDRIRCNLDSIRAPLPAIEPSHSRMIQVQKATLSGTNMTAVTANMIRG